MTHWVLHMWHRLLLQVTGIENLAAVEGAVYIKYNSVSKVSWQTLTHLSSTGRLQLPCFCTKSKAQRHQSNTAGLSQCSAVLSAQSKLCRCKCDVVIVAQTQFELSDRRALKPAASRCVLHLGCVQASLANVINPCHNAPSPRA
jgi:hypothetical protein